MVLPCVVRNGTYAGNRVLSAQPTNQVFWLLQLSDEVTGIVPRTFVGILYLWFFKHTSHRLSSRRSLVIIRWKLPSQAAPPSARFSIMLNFLHTPDLISVQSLSRQFVGGGRAYPGSRGFHRSPLPVYLP